MNIVLAFDDFTELSANGRLEKDGVTVTFGRPVLAEVEIDPTKGSGKVVFYLDEADERSRAVFHKG